MAIAAGRRVAHHERHGERRDGLAPRSPRIVWASSIVPMPPMPVPTMQPERSGAYGESSSSSPPRAAPRRGDERELGEPVGPALLLLGQEVRRLEVGARRLPVAHPDRAGGPALVEGAGAHAERRDGAHPRDDDLAHG
jgi:hypothetical protein